MKKLKKPDFMTFRTHALSGLTLVPLKQLPVWSRDDREAWVRKEYERHYGRAG
jgi:hypothetical protein